MQFRYASNRTISLGGKNTVAVEAGDRLAILSPGGGGFGLDGAEGGSKNLVGYIGVGAGEEGEDDDGIPIVAAGSVHEWRMKHEQQ